MLAQLHVLRTSPSQRAWDGVVPAACEPHPAVLCLRPDGAAWEQAREPLHRDIDAPGKPCGIGPGLAFANALLREAPGRQPLGLVPCAVGGSALREWELPDGKLGQRAVARARAALHAAGAGGDCAPGLACLLFYQGETDAMEAADAATWGARFARWVAAVREQLQAPELPVGVVAITAALAACPHLEAVRAAQLHVPAVVPRSFVVDAHGLALQADGLHLTTEAQVALGELLARAFADFEAMP
jgi:hypothetical protein